MATLAEARDAGNAPPSSTPFDAHRLDELMEEAGLDALVVTSKHNIQYLLGGHRFFFFDHFDAIGVSRYLPIFVYPKGRPERATYIGHPMERYERELDAFWAPSFLPSARTSTDGMTFAVEHIAALFPDAPRIGIERAFLPADAESVLREGLPRAKFADAQFPLERLRAVKTAQELEYLRKASDLVVDSMLAVDREPRRGFHQERDRRGAAPRGGQSRPHLRILPDHRGHELQPRAVRSDMAQRRNPLDRLGRQLQGLHRRSLPDGDSRRAGRGTGGSARRDRRDPDGGAKADPPRRARRRHLCRDGRSRAQERLRQFARICRARHGPDQPRGAAPHKRAARFPMPRTTPICRCRKAWCFRSRRRCATPARVHQTGGYGRGDASRLGGVRRSRPGLEPGRAAFERL